MASPFRKTLRSIVKAFLGFCTRLYFRRIEVIDEPPADVAGRVFAANHWNGIVDPLLILTTASYAASPIAKSTLWKMPGLRTLLEIGEAVPVARRQDDGAGASVDNDAIFDRVAKHLSTGGNLLIFPEGVSHNEPRVLPLKTGAARMLARAKAQGARGLSMQAVALDFDARDRFRSYAVVTYGPVREIDAFPDDAAVLVPALVARLTEDLDQLVISGRSQGEMLMVRQVAELLADETPDATLATRTEIARAVVVEARALGVDDPRYRRVADAVTAYRRVLDVAGLTDQQVARGQHRLPLRRLLRGIVLTAIAPIALLGALLYAVPYNLPKLATRIAHGETDVVSTYKLGIGLVAFPAWMAGLLAVAAVVAMPVWLHVVALVLVLGSPLCALAWLDRIDDRRGLRLLLSVSDRGRHALDRLGVLRRAALDAIAASRSAGGERERDVS